MTNPKFTTQFHSYSAVTSASVCPGPFSRVHDYNKDNQLDGLEMLHALMHNEHERGAVSMLFDQPIDTEQYISKQFEISVIGRNLKRQHFEFFLQKSSMRYWQMATSTAMVI